jgi:wyosine [tRNA(Phe)-imidazoG37] synthetase (radical SAM superfamily)
LPEEKKYFYGPVPSRRLGRSLGVDVIPFKVCTLDCIYCQLGKTTKKKVDRKVYVPADLIEAEFKEIQKNGLQADSITIAGAGEPTLNSQLGEIINRLKRNTDIPVAVVTNGTLFYRQDVRADCCKADIVLPSLDAGDEHTFLKINRPHPSISIEKHISGLCEFRKEYTGLIWLEVFIVEPVNTSDKQIAQINSIIEKIRPDKVQLNTAVRPTAYKDVNKVSMEKLRFIAGMLGPNCEVIADIPPGILHLGELHPDVSVKHSHITDISQTLFSMLKRRPCSLNDICSVMNLSQNEAVKYVTGLQQQGLIEAQNKEGITFYKAL